MTAFLSTINKQFIFARLAVIALFAGLFILSACGGAPVAANVTLAIPPERPDAPDGPCATDVFSAACGLVGEPARTIALNACRDRLQANPLAECEANIPAAAVACFKDPFDKDCKQEDYQAVLVRSSATPQIDTLRIERTQGCRSDTLIGDSVCASAIANTCDPAATASVATGTGDIRALLVTDPLCNDVAEYSAARADFLNDCRDVSQLKTAGCTESIINCAYSPADGGASSANPFDAACIDDDTYFIDRIVYCQVAQADEDDDFSPPAGCDVNGVNLVESYCDVNIFTATAGCSTNPDYAEDRIEFCIDSRTIRGIEMPNATLARCQNQVTFPALTVCFENPFGDGCDVLLNNDLTTAQTRRETHCRALESSDLAEDALCKGTITNFCDISEFDALCVADIYIDQRETTCRTSPSNELCADTIAGLCSDVFAQTLGDAPVNLCNDTQGGDTTYEADRLVACLANVQADESCAGTGGLIDTFCKANPFNLADDCEAEAYDINRETLCLNEPSNGSCGGIIEAFCIADPLMQTSETMPANLCGEAYNVQRETACRNIATAAVGTTAGCVDLVVKTCTFVAAVAGEGGGDGTPASGNPYDTLCDVAVYGGSRMAFCLDPFNRDNSSRCDGMIKAMCDENPFSTNESGMGICDLTYAPERLGRCRKDAAGTQDLPMGADCTDIIAGVCNNDLFDTLCPDMGREVSCRATPNLRCIPTIMRVCDGVDAGADSVPAAPFDGLCDDNVLYPNVSYTDTRAMACIGVASGGATPDTADVDRCPDLIMDFCMDNPFDTTNGYCQNEAYNTDRESMCSTGGAAFGMRDCVATIVRVCDVGNDIFNSVCDRGYRQARINDCVSETPSNSLACDTAEVYGTICGGDTGNDNTNPFDNVCATATEAAGVTKASLASARQAVVTFCNDAISNSGRNPTRVVCMTVQDTINDLNTDCVLAANAFDPRCDYEEYEDERATFCGVGGGADSFNLKCETEHATESLMGRKAFIILCREMPNTVGCATTPIDSKNPSVTIADCITNPYRVECYGTDEARNPDFVDETMARDMLCSDQATFFSPLCDGGIIAEVAGNREAYCTTNAGSFNPACDTEYASEAELHRKTFIVACRETRDAEGCATIAIDGSVYDSTSSVTIAHCITNPYRVECYGTDEARNPDFVDETMARDRLCADATKFFDPLCDGEVVAGVREARFARCKAEATTFDVNCDPARYSGTTATRIGLVNKCRAAEDATLLENCSQVVATMDGLDGFTRTVIDCIHKTIDNEIDNRGDPYQSGCFENTLFNRDRETRAAFCIIGGNAGNDARCTNASMQNLCINDPYGKDAEDAPCDAGTYRDARQLRTTYCSEDAGTDDPLCVSRKDFICVDADRGTRLAANPFALLCGDPGVVTQAQTAFCMDTNNMENDVNCAMNDAGGQALACPDNPFNDSFGLHDLDCTVDAYLPQRVTQCRDGTQTDASECDKTGIADVICRGTGAMANPFAAFCDDAQMAGFDGTTTLDSVRTTFADTCASDNVGDLICADAKSNLCLATGDYARPFATVCTGEDGIADIRETYCRADTAWEADCNPLATTDAAVIEKRTELLAACVGEEATRPLYCANKIAVGADEDFASCIETPFADACKNNAIDALLGRYRGDYCTTPVTSFHVDCNEAEYRGTNATQRAFAEVCERDRDATGCDAMTVGGVPIRDCVNDAMGDPYATGCAQLAGFEQQRIGRALDCAEDANGTGCTTPVSGVALTITVAGCNTTPFADGCSGDAFIHARRAKCIADGAGKHADCSVADGQGYTNYVQGSIAELVLGDSVYKDEDELATYMEDNPDTENIDESVIYVEDDPATTDIDESAVYVEDDRATPDINESLAFDDMGVRIPDNDMTPIDESRVRVLNDPTTPIDESRARVFDNPTTVLDESRIKIGTTYDAGAKVRREGIEQGGLTLSAIGGSGDNLTDSGFAYAYIPGGRGDDQIEGWDRYYAGLLSGTDVGDALTQQPANGAWHGRLAIVNGYGGEVRVRTSDFVLTVDFANKTLDADDVAVLDGLFNIDGRFTTGGVIYGLTSFRDRTPRGGKELIVGIDYSSNAITRETAPRLSSRGTVTGVIGVNGAVGAFISSGEGLRINTFGEYAGGFVASQTAPDPSLAVVDCSQAENVLNPICANNPDDVDLCAVEDLDTLKALSSPTASQTKCINVLEHTIARETACAGEADLNTLTEPLCEPVITQLCSAGGNIFNTAAGTNKAEDGARFDCTTITRYAARRRTICATPAYANGAVVELNGVVSVTKAIDCTAITEATCTDDPFTQTRERRPTNLCGANYNTARETACAQAIMDSKSDTIVTKQNRAPDKCLDTILTACRDNPFNTDLCYSKSGDFISTRLSACIKNPSVDTIACPIILATSCPTDGSPRDRECISDGFIRWRDNSTITQVAIPDGEIQNSRILIGGPRGLDTKTNVANIRVAETFLRFNSRYTRIDTGETVTRLGQVIPVYDFIENNDYYHGVSFFSAAATSGQIGHYAGILQDTQVGAPLTDSRVGAQWHGQFGFVSSDSDVPRQRDFVLNVDFSTRTISADDIRFYKSITREAEDTRSPNPFYIADTFSLTAEWEADTGVFTGTTTFTKVSPKFPDSYDSSAVTDYITLDEIVSTGVLTGIIGVDSAVGVFASDEIQADEDAIHYAGGFFALPPPRTKFNAWVGGFDETTRMNPAGDVLLAEGDFTRTDRADGTTYFIEGLATGLGLNANAPYVVNNQDDSAEVILRLDDKDGDFGYSGVAFWSGKIRNDDADTGAAGAFPTHSYGGLLSDTNVGGLLPRGGRAAPNGVLKLVWTGQISGIFNGIDAGGMIGGVPVDTSADGVTLDGKLLTNTDFTLLIDYTTGTIATLTEQSPFLDLILDGRFDANGIISGDVTGVSGHGDGRFNGLIGADGLVGVFKSNVGATAGFIGGFTATPARVGIADWTGSFDETTRMNTAGDVLLEAGDFTFTALERPADSSHFIEAGEHGLGLIVDGEPIDNNIQRLGDHVLRLDGTNGTPSDTSGAAFWAGAVRENADSANIGTHFYAGVLPDTQVGFLLPQEVGATFNNASSAIWTGTIRGIFAGGGIHMLGEASIDGLARNGNRLTDTNFQLLINYGAKTIKTPVGKTAFGNFQFSLDGTFEGGVMGGTLTPTPINGAPARSAARFIGLIGQDGAVGVFKSNNDAIANNGYVGGFVAKPSLPETIKAINWEASFVYPSSGANTIGANVAGDILLKEGIFTKEGRPTDSSHFIKAGADGIGLFVNGRLSLHSLYNIPERFLRLDGTIGTTGDASGVAFWAGNVRNNVGEVNESDTRVHLYAGLLFGTQVGLPLPQGAGATHNGAPSATWNGTIRGIFLGSGITTDIGEGAIDGLTRTGDGLTDTNFQLLVDYGARTIKTPVGKEFFGNFKFGLDGTFDGGVIAGTITPAPTESALMNRPAGRFNGVIGVDGAVGVFKSNNDETPSNSYVGGFVAKPPAP